MVGYCAYATCGTGPHILVRVIITVALFVPLTLVLNAAGYGTSETHVLPPLWDLLNAYCVRCPYSAGSYLFTMPQDARNADRCARYVNRAYYLA